MLAWLSVWSEVQTCIWPSWCHCHSLSLASVKSRLVLPFSYRLTRVVPEKGPLNGCVCVCVCVWCLTDLNVTLDFVRYVALMSPAQTAGPIEISFGGRLIRAWGTMYCVSCWLAPPGEYHWMIYVWWRYSFISNYFNRFVIFKELFYAHNATTSTDYSSRIDPISVIV